MGDGVHIGASSWEAMVVSRIQSYISFLADKGIDGPFVAHLSLVNVGDMAFVYPRSQLPTQTNRFSVETVAPFPVTVTPPDSDAAMWKTLTPLLKSVWRAAGYDRMQTKQKTTTGDSKGTTEQPALSGLL